MVVAPGKMFAGRRSQAGELELSTQGVDHAKHVFQPQGGLACFTVDDEMHTNACHQSQLGLRQAQPLARLLIPY